MNAQHEAEQQHGGRASRPPRQASETETRLPAQDAQRGGGALHHILGAAGAHIRGAGAGRQGAQGVAQHHSLEGLQRRATRPEFLHCVETRDAAHGAVQGTQPAGQRGDQGWTLAPLVPRTCWCCGCEACSSSGMTRWPSAAKLDSRSVCRMVNS